MQESLTAVRIRDLRQRARSSYSLRLNFPSATGRPLAHERWSNDFLLSEIQKTSRSFQLSNFLFSLVLFGVEGKRREAVKERRRERESSFVQMIVTYIRRVVLVCT